jgi:long-chain fatty acid transport protein
MKKLFTAFATVCLIAEMAIAGGIMTNTNQSASYIRMPARDASLSIDAVYFNPAGLTHLKDGFHLSLNNQVISQKREINSTLSSPFGFNNNDFEGTVSAPIFPSVYAAYKMNKFAFSFGFNPVGGGGGAEYATGLPSFEAPFSALPLVVSSLGVPTTQYDMDVYFKGSSIFFGFQGGVSYAISDAIGVFAGARYVMASNSYEGSLKNIQINPQHPVINPSGGLMSASTFFTAVGQPVFAALTADGEVEAVQKGSAITPILGLNIRPSEKFNIGIKYEFITELEVENETTKDLLVPVFPDGEKVRSDMPAMLSVGASYLLSEKLSVAAGIHYYFDKTADYGKSLPNDEIIDKNFVEYALALEYKITDKVLVSGGYLRTQTGVNEKYHTDLSHSLTTNTFGFGGAYAISPMIDLNLGVMLSMYEENKKDVTYIVPTTPVTLIPSVETYNRSALVFAIGVDFNFGK